MEHSIKQFETKEKSLNGHTFYIRPFPAFMAANISGELFSIILPMLGALVPMAGGAVKGGIDDILDLDIDFEKATPALVKGLSSLSGDKLEQLLKKLLVKHKNISVEVDGSDKVQLLSEDLANEVFCGNAQDMFILAIEVIQVNYSGFFERLGSLFGGLGALRGLVQRKTSPKNTES